MGTIAWKVIVGVALLKMSVPLLVLALTVNHCMSVPVPVTGPTDVSIAQVESAMLLVVSRRSVPLVPPVLNENPAMWLLSLTKLRVGDVNAKVPNPVIMIDAEVSMSENPVPKARMFVVSASAEMVKAAFEKAVPPRVPEPIPE